MKATTSSFTPTGRDKAQDWKTSFIGKKSVYGEENVREESWVLTSSDLPLFLISIVSSTHNFNS